ncbi:tagaturonate reductase [Flavilitoribacter nigricans]|uniref:Altronate oxidoreductase n=1 Tax=Flavilitoribacter nigricans (strain ATCC 23147 / DSM 23189 / NBRC 102662 / NCIMB 1420 / SS-2) TaxID=1122177 RepID=A0A2D0NCV2_FLAN2|nr:tagaturonate reductase [Flavilitoribacter nigricans]PHN06307.1 altronate oxidoreductase [Flavilitoribacter nigricans DSM 23189 = NBRC 102662]
MQLLNRERAGLVSSRPERVMQFGGGNFLRAFVDWMIDHLNKITDFSGNVVIIKPTERGDYQELRDQDGLFHVVLNGIRQGELVQEKTLVDCVSRVIHPYREWDAYLKLAEQEAMRYIVSNTTEAGIAFNETDKFADHPPREFPAKLTHWLYHRYTHFKGDPERGCVLLPVELIEQNGDELRNCILQYADHWGLEPGFATWVQEHNVFCNTLVDRIVSGYPDAEADDLQQELGFTDKLLVAGEYYHSWVIQAPEWVAREMHFDETDLEVKFVDDLTTYRIIKVRMLNGAHTAMVPVGYLSGMRSVREAVEEPHIGNYIRQLLHQEVMPTLDAPSQELRDFAQAVIDRFLNPSIHHQLISIALNSTSKYRTRLLPTLLAYQQKQGSLPPRVVLALAALTVFYKGEWLDEKIPLQDDPARLRFFEELWQKKDNDPEAISRRVLGQSEWWDTDLNEVPGLTDMLARFIELICTKGMYKTLLKLQ